MKKLAPAHMADCYLKLNTRAKDALGEQAEVTCDRGMYWVRVFPVSQWGGDDSTNHCLGENDEYASKKLEEIIAYWHRWWREQSDMMWEQEYAFRHREADEYDSYEDWYKEVRGKGT